MKTKNNMLSSEEKEVARIRTESEKLASRLDRMALSMLRSAFSKTTMSDDEKDRLSNLHDLIFSAHWAMLAVFEVLSIYERYAEAEGIGKRNFPPPERQYKSDSLDNLYNGELIGQIRVITDMMKCSMDAQRKLSCFMTGEQDAYRNCNRALRPVEHLLASLHPLLLSLQNAPKFDILFKDFNKNEK
jgi:hypothetical protein